MSSLHKVHYAGDPTPIIEIPGYGIVLAAGLTVPSDAATGYAIGCLFIHLDGTAGSTLYCNEGTTNSCDFDAVTVG